MLVVAIHGGVVTTRCFFLENPSSETITLNLSSDSHLFQIPNCEDDRGICGETFPATGATGCFALR